MRKILGLMLLAFTVSTAAPAFANSYTDCNSAPKSEWAQCVFDQAAEHDGQ